jgi:DNA-binding NtrC family response regulator
MDSTKRILIIDDEPHLRASLGMVLKRAGYSPVLASGAAEALKFLENDDPFDLAFLDLNMPGTGGLDLLPTLSRFFPDLPIIILTGNGNIESLDEAQSWGARGYLLKPVNPWEIVERVKRIIKDDQLRKQRNRILRDLQGIMPELRGDEPGTTPLRVGV